MSHMTEAACTWADGCILVLQRFQRQQFEAWQQLLLAGKAGNLSWSLSEQSRLHICSVRRHPSQSAQDQHVSKWLAQGWTDPPVLARKKEKKKENQAKHQASCNVTLLRVTRAISTYFWFWFPPPLSPNKERDGLRLKKKAEFSSSTRPIKHHLDEEEDGSGCRMVVAAAANAGMGAGPEEASRQRGTSTEYQVLVMVRAAASLGVISCPLHLGSLVSLAKQDFCNAGPVAAAAV
ncbi:hypothetical protein ACQKWADRAFT_206456 [Trichoderma austrokoningii]